MSDLEDRINSLLNSPEDMEKITQIAKSIMNDQSAGSGKREAPSSSSGHDSPKSPGGAGGIDPGMLASLGKLMSKTSSGNDKGMLVEAMKPYLSEKRREKLARAIQIAKMAKLAGSVFSDYGGGTDV